MSDDRIGVILIFFQELLGTREGYLVDVFVDIFRCHAYTTVADREGSGFFVDGDFHVHFP